MPRQGESLGKYRLVRRIGLGGMAEVWHARVSGPGGFTKNLVVKTVLEHHAQNEEFVAQFFDEARLAAMLTHPNVAQIFELGEHHGIFYIAMELVRGQDLQALRKEAVAREKGLPFPILARIICGVCEGLHYAHELNGEDGALLNLVHRDVSPENILVSYDGVVKIVDFGIAKASINQVTTKAGLFKGKLQYAAPQRLLNIPIDRRDDIYSLGAVMYKTATGHVPISADSDGAMIKAILDGEFQSPREIEPDVPEELETIILKAMEWDPEDRYQTTREIQRDLEKYIASTGQPVTTHEVSQFMRRCFADEIERSAQVDESLDADEAETAADTTPGTVFGLGGQKASVQGSGTVVGHPIDERPALPVPPKEPPLKTEQLMTGWKPSRFRSVATVIGIALLLAVGIGIGMWAPWRVDGTGTAEGSTNNGPVGGGPAVDAGRAPDAAPAKRRPRRDGGGLFAKRPPSGDATPTNDSSTSDASTIATVGDSGAAREAMGSLQLRGPGTCTARIGDEVLGDLPLARQLPVGPHTVDVRCASGARRELRITIREGQETSESVRLGEGTLQLLVRPWAEVYIGGRKMGITPMAPITLTEGRYSVRLVNNDLGVTKTRRVRIRRGQQQTLRVRLQ